MTPTKKDSVPNVYRSDLSQTALNYAKYSHLFKEAQCYINAFTLLAMLMSENDEQLNKSSLKGVIGYILSENDVEKAAVRHCWLKYTDKYTGETKAIDVTPLAEGYSVSQMLYYQYLEIVSYTPQQWLEITEKNNGIPCVEGLKGEDSILKYLQSEGYNILG